MITSRPTQVAANTLFPSFLWLSSVLGCVCVCVCVYTPQCSSVSEHLRCFHDLVIVNSAAMNTGVYVSFQIRIFFRYMPRSGMAGSYGNSGFPSGSGVKKPPLMQAVQEMQVFLGREDLLKEGMATHSSILAWRISWRFSCSLVGCSPEGGKELNTTEVTACTHTW